MFADEEFGLLLYFIVGGAIGLLCGLVPLVAGFVKGGGKHIGLGVSGFFATLVGGSFCGLLLALPVAITFLVIILVTPKPSPDPRHQVNDDAYGTNWHDDPDDKDNQHLRTTLPNQPLR